jgi:hypothetical protein
MITKENEVVETSYFSNKKLFYAEKMPEAIRQAIHILEYEYIDCVLNICESTIWWHVETEGLCEILI